MWLFQFRLEPKSARFRNSNLAGARLGDNSFFGSQNNTPDETNGVNNAVSCYEVAVQFSASFITSLFARFIFTKFVEFGIFRPGNTTYFRKTAIFRICRS